MSFGKDKSGSTSKSKTVKDTPPNFSSPYGDLNFSSGKYTYDPNENPINTNTRETTEERLNQLVNTIPTSYSAADMFDNPYYSTLSGLYRGQLETQRAQDQKTLNDNLSARNQLGSSYDAYSNYLMNQDYGRRYDQADQQARLGSADAYNQAINTGLNSLNALRNDYTQGLNAYYQPLSYGLAAQGAYAPFINSTTTGSQSAYSSPSFLSRYNQMMQTNAQIAQAVIPF